MAQDAEYSHEHLRYLAFAGTYQKTRKSAVFDRSPRLQLRSLVLSPRSMPFAALPLCLPASSGCFSVSWLGLVPESIIILLSHLSVACCRSLRLRPRLRPPTSAPPKNDERIHRMHSVKMYVQYLTPTGPSTCMQQLHGQPKLSIGCRPFPSNRCKSLHGTFCLLSSSLHLRL